MLTQMDPVTIHLRMGHAVLQREMEGVEESVSIWEGH